MKPEEILRRRRCMALRIAFFLGVVLAVVNRTDRAILGVALAGTALALVTYWRNCRRGRDSS